MTMIICAWCAKVLQEGDYPVSHGICPECAAKLREELHHVPID